MYRGWIIPTYDYECEGGHIFELIAGYDDEMVPCDVWVYHFTPPDGEMYEIECNLPAKRLAVYQSQGIIFKGDNSVVVPSPPLPKSTQGLTSDQAVEVWDGIAKENYQYDKNDRPYLYEEDRAYVAQEGLSIEQAAEAAAEGKALPQETKDRAAKARRKRGRRARG